MPLWGPRGTMRRVLTEPRLSQLSRELRASMGDPAGADAAMSPRARRAGGVFFTPQPLVRFVAAAALEARVRREPLAWRSDGSPMVRVLDPAAGDGRFLVAAVELLVERAVARGSDAASVRARITRQCVIGLERDHKLAELARERLGPGARVHCREALLDAPAEVRGVDVVIGNPPYVRSIRLAETDPELWRAVRGRYEATSHGEWDLYAAFLEQALEWTGPAGEVGLVVPSRWLTARFAMRLRSKLAARGAVRAVVDFGAEQVFPGATTYASVAFLSRASQDAIEVARLREGRWHCGHVEGDCLGRGPWRLSVGPRRDLLARLGDVGPRLGDLAGIAKGAGTNADRVYVLEDAELHGDVVHGVSRELGRRVEVESGLARPCLRGRDVTAYGAADGSVRCVVPYGLDGRLLAPESVPPLGSAYLRACRARLDRREKGRFRGDTFYRFGRPQNMALLGDASPKLVVPDVARDGRALLDATGAMVLDSAYVLRLLPGVDSVSLALLLAILNSPMVALWLRETGIPLRGGYVRLKTAYLSPLPIPAPSPARRRVERAVIARAPADEVAELVRVAYGVESEDWPDSASSTSAASSASSASAASPCCAASTLST